MYIISSSMCYHGNNHLITNHPGLCHDKLCSLEFENRGDRISHYISCRKGYIHTIHIPQTSVQLKFVHQHSLNDVCIFQSRNIKQIKYQMVKQTRSIQNREEGRPRQPCPCQIDVCYLLSNIYME